MPCMSWASGTTCSIPAWQAASPWACTRASPASMKIWWAAPGGFIEAIYPTVQQFFPEQLGGVSAEQFYRAVNKAQPSLVRTESDELTYCLHVMVRYEIEKQLIGGTLEAKGCSGGMGEALQKNISASTSPNDRDGCLQDSHWSSGAFGYFPSYALGNAYGAQMLHNMEQDVDVEDSIAKGELAPHHSLAARESAPVRRAVCPGGCGQERLRYL